MQVFPPSFRELPPPPLELFDLDESFSSAFSRLAQFTNKFMSTTSSENQTEKQLEFYIQECAKIVKLGLEVDNPKVILFEVANQCSTFKSIEPIK